MTRPGISDISLFFIVKDAAAAFSFYRDHLGFAITYQEPADDRPLSACRWAFLVRNRLLSKSIVRETMNRLIVIVLTTVAFANALFAQEQPSINPASIYHLGGVTVVSPNQSGWVLLQSNKSLIAFQKRLEGEVLNASVKTIRTKPFDNDKDLLTSLEALKVEELSKLKKDSVHFNYVRFKESPCVQYDGIFTGDPAAPNFKYLNFKGYLCRYHESKDLVVQIEFSNNSNLRAFSENLIDLSNEFFEKIAFPKVAGK